MLPALLAEEPVTQHGQLLSGLSAVRRGKEITTTYFRFRKYRMDAMLYLSQSQRPDSFGGESNRRTDRQEVKIRPPLVSGCNSFTVKHLSLRGDSRHTSELHG